MRSAFRNPRPATAFTLVELLVVVAIIVVLLALLVPSMQRAIYQALLVQCAANQKVVGSAATTYAFENKRFYPSRNLPVADDVAYFSPMTLYSPQKPDYDLRPMLRDKLRLNVNLNTQCPLVEPVQLEENLANEILVGNQSLWFGWRYFYNGKNLRAMDRIDDNFEAYDRFGKRHTLNLLVSDYDVNLGDSSYQASHPDSKKNMYNWINKRTVFVIPAYTITISLWQSPALDRGTMDLNFMFSDGSVRRQNAVRRHDWTGGEDDSVIIPNERQGRSGWQQVPRH